MATKTIYAVWPCRLAFLPTEFECVQTVWFFIKMSDWPFLRKTIDMLIDARTLGRLHSLLDDDRTKIIKLTDGNAGMSALRVAQELGHKCKMVCTTLKKDISPVEFPCCTS